MLDKDIERKIKEIVNDSADSIENRIDRVMTLRNETEETGKEEMLAEDAACFRALIEMLLAEHANLSNAFELLELYTLLAETYVEMKDYRPVKDIAYKVATSYAVRKRHGMPWRRQCHA